MGKINKILSNSFKLILIALIKFYRYFISPLFGPACRFYPTCSQYAEQALEQHSWWYAVGLIIYRLLRCQPFCKGGKDPLPRRSNKII